MLQFASDTHMNAPAHLDDTKASETLDVLIEFVSTLLPVNDDKYPAIRHFSRDQTVEFCLRHSALHFSKTAGRLAAYVEEADHGRYADIQILQSIVAASIVNSLKLADEIGISGPDIMEQIRDKFAQREAEE